MVLLQVVRPMPVLIGKHSSSFINNRCSIFIYKHDCLPILRTQSRYFFKKFWRPTETDNTPMVINNNNKTLIVVKSNSHLFKKVKIRERGWKYSPMKYVNNVIREAFPLRTVYRADMSQGMAQLYEDLNEQMDLPYFIRTFDLPNNMASWMKVCELHIHLICAKFRPEEYLGKAAIEYLMIEYFNDIGYRSRRIAPYTGLYKEKQIRMIKSLTKSIFMEYDVGLQESDMVLAAALWRRFFGCQCYDSLLVERLVKYIRVQLTHLRTIKFKDFIFYRLKLFVPLSEVGLEKKFELMPTTKMHLEKRKLYSSTLPWINEKTYMRD